MDHLVKIKMTKDVGPFKKDQIVYFDENSAKQLVDDGRGKRTTAAAPSDESPTA